MKSSRLIVFTGFEYDGLYSLTKKLKDIGLRCGIPNISLSNPFLAAKMPIHSGLWFWQATQRFFGDMGLPPIAEVPRDLVSPESHEYYVNLFARSLFKLLDNGSFICADHKIALIFPLIFEAIEKLNCNGIETKIYFFFANPRRGIAEANRKAGAPFPLGEFIWRNTVAAAGRHSSGNIKFVEIDRLDEKSTTALFEEIINFYGVGDLHKKIRPLVMPACDYRIPIHKYSWNIYQALQTNDHKMLEKIAEEVYEAQSAQNGWQYIKCLDCHDFLETENKTLAFANLPLCQEEKDYDDLSLDMNNDSWVNLLDEAERKLLVCNQDHAARLFMFADSLSNFYNNRLDDEKILHAKVPEHEKKHTRRMIKNRRSKGSR